MLFIECVLCGAKLATRDATELRAWDERHTQHCPGPTDTRAREPFTVTSHTHDVAALDPEEN
jgi:hypothetical protein